MPHPTVLSTWSFGQRANAAAWPALVGGSSALDAVEAACRHAEDDVTNHTVGRGGYPDHTGRVSLDAMVMTSPARSGAVCGIRKFVEAVAIARAVMERTAHRMLCGADADDFATSLGFTPTQLLTDDARDAWARWVRAGRPSFPLANLEDQIAARRSGGAMTEANHDTIGALAIDATGTMAGGCTTSGLAFKLAGRVGDSPTVGHGLYVEPGVGACVCSGRGEMIIGVCAALVGVDALRAGKSSIAAARAVCERLRDVYPLGPDDQVGIVVLSAAGEPGIASLLPGFRASWRTADRDEVREPDFVLGG